MSFLKLSQKPSKKASSKAGSRNGRNGNQNLLGFDLLYQLTYLSAIAAAGIPRGQMFRVASKLPSSAAWYFREIDQVASSMNYQYSEACRIVGESVKEPEVKSLLLRLSSSLSTGESAADFMAREAYVQAESYENVYERKLESVKKWTDGYIALMVSVTLIMVVAALSTVIYDMGTTFVLGLVGVMLVVSGLGSWIIYRSAPQEVSTLSGPEGHKSQRLPRTMFFILAPLALVVGALFVMAKMPIGLALAAMGVIVFPIGVVSWRLDSSINKEDKELSTFLRALGTTASATGTTPTEALGRMDLRAIGYLAPAVGRLHTMLRSRVAPEMCWHRFVVDAGSELIRRGVKVFTDAISLGGDAEEVGSRTALLTMKVDFMREKRKLVASTFKWLCLAMHGVIVFLLIFVLEVVNGFGKMVQSAGVVDVASGGGAAATSVVSFNFANLEFLRWLLIPVVIVLSLVNAITPSIVEGGYVHKLFFNLGVTLFTGGLALLMAPKIATMLFRITPIS